MGSPSAVVRFAGLPTAALATLRSDRSTEVGDALIDSSGWLTAEGSRLSDLLFDVIGSLPVPSARPALVGLRRAVFQGRRPTDGEWNATTRDLLPAPLADRVERWISGLATHRRMRTDLESAFAADLESAQRALRTLCAEPAFRRALSHASASLSGELDKWLAREDRRCRPQTMFRLAKFVARAVTKTSPYSTFTLSGGVEWTSAPAPPVALHLDQRPIGVLELPGSFLAALRSALAARPELAPGLAVRVNPSATITADSLEFLGRAPAESIVTVGRVPSVDACLALLADRGGQRTLPDLVAALGSAAASPEAAGAFVAKLVRGGLLELQVPVADQSPDFVGDLAAWVESAAPGSPVAAQLADLRADLRADVPVPDLAGSRSRAARVHRAMDRLAGELGITGATGHEQSASVLHETAVVLRPAARCSSPAWRTALADLDVVRRWLTVFDTELPKRLALADFADQQFGGGDGMSALALHRATQLLRRGDAGAPTSTAARDLRTLLDLPAFPYTWSLPPMQSERLRTLADIRAQAQQLAAAPADPDGVIRLSADRLAASVQAWPSWLTRPTSVSCYVQLIDAGDPVRLVLNTTHAGHGRGRSRVTRLMAAAGADDAGEPAPAADGTRSVVAEIDGLFGSTLNARTPTAPYEIEYPFTVSARPADQRLPLGDLDVVRDPDTDLLTLTSRRLGLEVRPVHAGMLMNLLLPPAARFLTEFFGPSYPVHPAGTPLSSLAYVERPTELVRYSRIEVGRIVLRRARWLVSAEQIPGREPGLADDEYFLRLLTWSRENGIPRCCFVRAWRTDNHISSATARKPVFLDFTNWLLMVGFERQVRDSQLVLLEEALPSPDEFPTVTEYLLELGDDQAAPRD